MNWLALALIAGATLPGADLLARARWTWRTPRTAIILWQALGLAWGVATIGALLGFALEPYGKGIIGGLARLYAGDTLDLVHQAVLVAGMALAGSLIGMLLRAGFGALRARNRHRALLTLIAHADSSVRGALVVDHPAAAAYCVPGVRSKIIISAGTIELLDSCELAAVLAHEHAHARERHDLVLLPFSSLPRIGLVARSLDAVALLVEMTADDRALQNRPARELATALLRFATAPAAATPSCALSALPEGGVVMARVQRLLHPVPQPVMVRTTALTAAALLVVAPMVLWVLPH